MNKSGDVNCVGIISSRSMSVLSIYAGPTAYQRLQQEGFNPDLFKVLLGASGGPKWFVLYGLDRYLFAEYFAGRSDKLLTLGSSAGAWRLSCLATADPLRAIDTLARLYSEQTYSATPTIAEITEKMRHMLVEVLGPDGPNSIVNNTVFQTHIVADRCKGIGNAQSKPLQAAFLAMSAAANALSRRNLSRFYQRSIFTSQLTQCPWRELDDLDTQVVALSQENVIDAMLASGSIPFLLEGVRNIAGAREGMYWDGGITDYHFDMPFYPDDGLVLYPHFGAKVIPGWFDKHLPWRKPHASNFSNVVIIAPSPQFVAELPNGKIPDRTDFERYSEAERLQIWSEVLERSKLLAIEFQQLVERGAGIEEMQLLTHP